MSKVIVYFTVRLAEQKNKFLYGFKEFIMESNLKTSRLRTILQNIKKKNSRFNTSRPLIQLLVPSISISSHGNTPKCQAISIIHEASFKAVAV